MRFLADESCDAALVRALRTARHDVISIAQTSAGVADRVVLELAMTGERVLLTRDKDFGELVRITRLPPK
jgi:predicted nuclease of predicted toxin-antitoxin system